LNDNTSHLVKTRPAYFLDFEASSLASNSWPVEIGISRVVDGAVVTESHLIKPHPDWEDEGWSVASAEIHGLSRAHLEAEGLEASEVATWFQERNIGLAITDNPEFEQRWLIRLLATNPPFPPVHLLDFDSYVRMSLPDAAAVSRVYRAMDAQGPPPHRAGPDAERLATAWLNGAG
jgi:DNA polymerase-3 subunit epsilon